MILLLTEKKAISLSPIEIGLLLGALSQSYDIAPEDNVAELHKKLSDFAQTILSEPALASLQINSEQ